MRCRICAELKGHITNKEERICGDCMYILELSRRSQWEYIPDFHNGNQNARKKYKLTRKKIHLGVVRNTILIINESKPMVVAMQTLQSNDRLSRKNRMESLVIRR